MDVCKKGSMKLYILAFSFKERGARYALLMLSSEQKKRGVISASLGNHAQVLTDNLSII